MCGSPLFHLAVCPALSDRLDRNSMPDFSAQRRLLPSLDPGNTAIRCRKLWLAAVAAMILAAPTARSDETTSQPQQQFDELVRPMLEMHCYDCHDSDGAQAGLNLTAFETVQSVTERHLIWKSVWDHLAAETMPPPDYDSGLEDDQRAAVVRWIRGMLQGEAARNAGDPGPVLPRRLSNAEYDYSIIELTGQNLKPTATFPVDPANEYGFDNSAESLAMSPALMGKYLEAARLVADHLVFGPSELRFAAHPVVTDTDRDKYCVNRIVDFYQQQPTQLNKYLSAIWQWQHDVTIASDTDAVPSADEWAGLDRLAQERGLSVRYTRLVAEALFDDQPWFGPMGEVLSRWQAACQLDDPQAAAEKLSELEQWISQARRRFEPQYENFNVKQIHVGSQAFVLWKNRQYAANRRVAHFDFFEREPADDESELERQLRRQYSEDPTRFQADSQQFCHVFPDAFYVSERGRDYLGIPREKQEKGRLLSAGFHSMMGYFRDDGPLCDLILSDADQQHLDLLWRELEVFAQTPMRQYQSLLWFERTDSLYLRDREFDFARPENLESLTEPMIQQLAERYTEKAIRNGAAGDSLAAIEQYFVNINREIREVERQQRLAQPIHVEQMVHWASRAFRRPLETGEADDLRDFYHRLRQEDELGHEEAIQDLLVAILMSPSFLYRMDALSDTDQPRPLDDYELAARLSFFLWSQLPDEQLLQRAADGQLRSPEVLLAETRRMMDDPRIEALAKEFAGNWLDIRRFEEHNAVDRERFPQFDDRLRQAMFEEPLRFFVDMVQTDGSIVDFIDARHTFVNRTLAEHYEIPWPAGVDERQWIRVADADQYGRGGLLPMAVFLTKNAPGLRTSPVKRGNWVVQRVLGERIAPPPPDVPELPSDESQMAEISLREALAKHRDHSACAGCHNRIDPVGLVFEGFGPIGERRSVDLGGRPVDTQTVMSGDWVCDGVEDLKQYIRARRHDDFVEHFTRQLLAYSLGRSLILADEVLLQDLHVGWEEDGYRLRRLIEKIVTSQPFLHKRGRLERSVSVVAPLQ